MEQLKQVYDCAALRRDIRAFCGANPEWRCIIIGRSRQGRSIRALQRGCGGVLIHAAHHANEWITSAVLMRWLLRMPPQANAVIVPMVNPDGVELMMGRDTLWARSMTGNVPFPSGWKANAAGVDLNLNYPVGWEQAVELKRRMGVDGPSARNWPGPQPLSEPETCAMVQLCEQGFERSLSLHSQGAEIYWQYGGIAPEGALALAERMASVSGYTVAEPPETASHAGFKDWFLLRYQRPAYTVEMGRGENPLPLSDFGTLCEEMFPLLNVFSDG